jgi:hypothetical protein
VSQPSLDPIDASVSISRRLRECGIPHAVGGALAYNYYGVPRATGDVDFNIFLSQDDAARVLACLKPLGLEVDDPGVMLKLDREWQTRIQWRNLPIDLFFAYHPFHESCRARATEMPLAGVPVPVLSAEDVVIFKVIFNRPRDWGDIERVLAVQGARFDLDHALHWLDQILGPDDNARKRLVEMHRTLKDP